MDLENQEYLLLELQALILAIAIAIPLAIGGGVKSPILIAVYVIIAYYFILYPFSDIYFSGFRFYLFTLRAHHPLVFVVFCVIFSAFRISCFAFSSYVFRTLLFVFRVFCVSFF